MIYKEGRDRHVIIDDYNRKVIKVAKNINGLEQNYNEFMFNKKRPDLTAKIYFYAGDYLVMEYVEELRSLKYHKHLDDNHVDKEKEDRWWYVFNELGKELGESLDNDQIGETNDGRIVCYDYGHNVDFINRTYETIKEEEMLVVEETEDLPHEEIKEKENEINL